MNGYVQHPAQFEILPVAVDAAIRATKLGAALVIVTNQGMIARQMATEADLLQVHARLLAEFSELGVHFDAIYACPHHPLAPDPRLRACECRKPRPGLLLAAAADLRLDLSRSVLIGDDATDEQAALAAGLQADHVVLIAGDDQAIDGLRLADIVERALVSHPT